MPGVTAPLPVDAPDPPPLPELGGADGVTTDVPSVLTMDAE